MLKFFPTNHTLNVNHSFTPTDKPFNINSLLGNAEEEVIITKKPKKKRVIYKEESDSEEEVIVGKAKPKPMKFKKQLLQFF